MKSLLLCAALLVSCLSVQRMEAAAFVTPIVGGSGGGTNISLSVTSNIAATGPLRLETTNLSMAPVFVWDGSGPNTNAPGVILDMDYGGDVDDAFDLKLACKLHLMGLIRLLAVTHSSSNNWGASSISAALAYYGVKVPVGISKVPTAVTTDVYGSFVATNTANPAKFWFTNSNDAKDVMRFALANSPNSNVVIITTGPIYNIQRLIDSTSDANSALTGSQLLVQKLRPDLGMIIVACYFTNSAGNLNGPEFNSSAHLNAFNWVNAYVPNSFPVTWFGEEVFETVQTGLGWQTNISTADPVFHAMRLAGVASRPAWAQGAIMLAGYGTNWTYGSAAGSNVFSFSGGGTNQITAGGSNIWWNGSYIGQKYAIRQANTNWLGDIVNALVMPSAQDAKDYLSRSGDDTWSGKKSGTNNARLYLGANPSGYISQIFGRNNASASGVMTLQDFTASAASHFFFGLHEDNYIRGGRNLAPDHGYNFFNTIAGDNNNVFGNGANSNVLNGFTVVSNVVPWRMAIYAAGNVLTNLDSSPIYLGQGTNAVLLQGLNTEHVIETNGNVIVNLSLAVPTNGQIASITVSNRGGSPITVTPYTNSQAAAVWDVASQTNITSWPVTAGGMDTSDLKWMGTYWRRTFRATEGRLAVARSWKNDPALSTNGQQIILTVTGTNSVTYGATNTISLHVDFTGGEIIYLPELLVTNLVIIPTNMVLGRELYLVFPTNPVTYNLSISNAAGTVVRYLTQTNNGNAALTKTNSIQMEMSLLSLTNGLSAAVGRTP